MRAILFLAATCLALLAADVDARGRRSSSGGAKTQYVHSYTKADGTHVNAYWRSGPNHAPGVAHAPGATAGLGGFDSNDTDWAKGLGKQAAAAPVEETKCVYSEVMTDDEIAACRRQE